MQLTPKRAASYANRLWYWIIKNAIQIHSYLENNNIKKHFTALEKKHILYAWAAYNLFSCTVQHNSNKIKGCKSGITAGLWEDTFTQRFLLISLKWLKEARYRIKSSCEWLGNTHMSLIHKKASESDEKTGEFAY